METVNHFVNRLLLQLRKHGEQEAALEEEI